MKERPVRNGEAPNKSVAQLEESIEDLHAVCAFMCGASLSFKRKDRKPFKTSWEKLNRTVNAIKLHLEEHGIHYPKIEEGTHDA